MNSKYRVGVIGAGRPWKTEGATGFGMAHGHVKGFLGTGQCELAAVADISEENARAFVDQYGSGTIYSDYHEMLRRESLDIVSICTWPHLHEPMTLAAAEARVKGIYCEKPMAPTWGESKRMHEACVRNGVTLAFNHQRRFLEPFQRARALIDDGALGPLRHIEGQCADLFDWGTHWLDMFFFYNGETPAEWVIGQIDSREEKKVFGVPLENQGFSHFKFRNGVRATLLTGYEAAMGCANRIIGDKGMIEIGWEAPWLRIRTLGDAEWRVIPTEEGIHDGVAIDRATADFVRALQSGGRPLLSSYNAIQSTEVIFATYESSRRRGRVDLPLEQEDSAFLTMLEQGDVGPKKGS